MVFQLVVLPAVLAAVAVLGVVPAEAAAEVLYYLAALTFYLVIP
jgi:hypothetical protein